MGNRYLHLGAYPDLIGSFSDNEPKSKSPFHDREIKKTVERIAFEKKSKGFSVLEDLISDKAKTLKASVNALLEEISLREDLNVSMFKKIDDEVCKLRGELMQLNNLSDSYPFDLSAQLDEAKFRLKENVLELERERRAEGLECWRDLMGLKKDLMVALKEYWELVRRRGRVQGN